MAVNQDTLYVKGDRNVEVTKREVTLGDLVSMECSNRVILPHLKTMKVLKIPENGEKRYVISILKIIACIHEKYPGLEVQNLGETDLIVTYEMQKTPSKWVHVAKTILVVLITFFGAAFSMMAFNNDVDVDKLFGYIYYWMTGKQSSGFTILEVSYSVGITIGILVFFNHFGKRRFLGLIGLSSGVAVAGGLFAFIVELGVVADLADRTHTAESLLLYEDSIALGGILGNAVFCFQIMIPCAGFILPFFGVLSGIFVGCWAMALAEILNVFPIFIRRVKLVRYIKWFIIGIALGKGFGACIAFFQ